MAQGNKTPLLIVLAIVGALVFLSCAIAGVVFMRVSDELNPTQPIVGSFFDHPAELKARIAGEIGDKAKIRSMMITKDLAEVYYLDERRPKRITVYPASVLSRGGAGANEGKWVALHKIDFAKAGEVRQSAGRSMEFPPTKVNMKATGKGQGRWWVRDWKKNEDIEFDLDGGRR